MSNATIEKPTILEKLARPWFAQSQKLAELTLQRMVNRVDAWGLYYATGGAFTAKATDELLHGVPGAGLRGELDQSKMILHFACIESTTESIIGLLALGTDNLSRWLAFDSDCHDRTPEAIQSAHLIAVKIWHHLKKDGLHPILEDSGGGFKVWVLLREPTPSRFVYDYCIHVKTTLGFPKTESFPKQAGITPEKFGNYIRIPGKHHKRNTTSTFWDGEDFAADSFAVQIWIDFLESEGDVLPIVPPIEGIDEVVPTTPPTAPTAPTPTAPMVSSDPSDVQRLRDLLAVEPNRDRHYDDWIDVGIICKYHGGGVKDWATWSAKSPKHVVGECEKKWDGLPSASVDKPITLKTLERWLKEDQIAVPPDAVDEWIATEALTMPPTPTPTTKNKLFRIIPLEEHFTMYPLENVEVIEGLLRACEVANVVAPTKSFKTFAILGLALATSTGDTFFGHQCTKGRVLILDNELHGGTVTDRFKKILAAKGLTIKDIKGMVDIITFREREELPDLVKMAELFKGIKAGEYAIIILDALYRAMPKGFNENDNSHQTAMYNLIAGYARMTGSAMVIVHHSTKGDQGSKSITDVGAGGGAQSRAVDTHMVIRQHEKSCKKEKIVVVEAETRTFAQPEASCWRFAYPLYEPISGLNPEDIKGRARKDNKDATPLDAETFAIKYTTKSPKKDGTIISDAERDKVGVGEAKRLLTAAVDKGFVVEHTATGRGGAKTYSRTPEKGATQI